MTLDDLKNFVGNLLGRKTEEPEVQPKFVEGPPVRGTWYKLVGSNGRDVIGHSFVCRCNTEYKHPTDIFDWQKSYKCGCGESYSLKDWLEAMALKARLVAAYARVGLPPEPTPEQLADAKRARKVIKVKTGEVEKEEIQRVYYTLQYRWANPAKQGNYGWPKGFIDTWNDPRFGGGTGEVEYEQSSLGGGDASGFGDPMSTRLRPH